jgi:thermitase
VGNSDLTSRLVRPLRTAAPVLALVAAMAAGLGAVPGTTAAAGPGAAPFRPGVVLVGLQPGLSSARQQAIAQRVGARRVRRLGSVTAGPHAPLAVRRAAATELVDVGGGSVPSAVQALRRQPDVRYAEPDYLMREDAAPSDPGFGLQWGLSNTGQSVNGLGGTAGADDHATAAWNLTTGTRSVVVAETDSGVDYTHPDLNANIWTNPGGVGNCPAGSRGYNVLTGTCDPMDDETVYGGHGTHVAGIIGADGGNGIGVTGVNWKTTILPVKWLDSGGWGSTSQLIAALDWVLAAKKAGVNVRVVNDSATFVGDTPSTALSDEIGLLAANDILFVTAAGNTGDDNDDPSVGRYPCRYGLPNEICVTASNQSDALPSWANYGPGTVDLAAPGDNIYSTLRGGTYGYVSGGSMAAPQVSGAAALILSRGYQSATALKADILGHVDVLPSLAGRVRTGGRLDICKAMPGCPVAPPPPSQPPPSPPPPSRPPPSPPPPSRPPPSPPPARAPAMTPRPVTTTPPPTTTRPPTSPKPPTASRPQLSLLRLRPASFHVVRPGSSASALRGTRISYWLSARATTVFRVARIETGARSGHACVRLTRRLRGRARCTRLVWLRTTLQHRGGPGLISLAFGGRPGGHPLRPGRFRLRAQAYDAAGRSRETVTVAFRVLRG